MKGINCPDWITSVWIIEIQREEGGEWLRAPLAPVFATEVPARAHAAAMRFWGLGARYRAVFRAPGRIPN